MNTEKIRAYYADNEEKKRAYLAGHDDYVAGRKFDWHDADTMEDYIRGQKDGADSLLPLDTVELTHFFFWLIALVIVCGGIAWIVA